MVFPRPCIIYLDAGKKEKIPDEYTLILEFEGQGEYMYKVPVVKLQNISIKELNDKKLVALFPFLLLKLRKKIQKRRTQAEIDELQKLIIDDILWTIDRNEEVGNISPTDAYHLKVLTNILYMQIYSEYTELEELTVKLYDQSLELPADKYEKTVEDLQEEVKEMKDILEEKDASLKEKDAKLKELEERIKELEKIVETK